MSIVIEYGKMLSPPVANGVTLDEMEEARADFDRALKVFSQRRSDGQLGFLDLPADNALADRCRNLAAEMVGRWDDVVVLGIGGSALGTTALRSALLPYGWNMRSNEQRGGVPRLHVLDNVDPVSVDGLLGLIDIRSTLFLVISKSGSTAETMAQYLIVRGRLTEAMGDEGLGNILLLTDPERGALREIALRDGISSFEIPPNVGGRFSVLSSVGLVPAALVGIDIHAILRGAQQMLERCTATDFTRNPAGLYAVMQWLAHTRHGCSVQVFMPYSDAMRDMADWFVQLWAESLGKHNAAGTPVGPTPLASVGVTDQHSQVQLFMEGPLDKTITFLSVGSHGAECTIPAVHFGSAELAYLAGRDLGELLDAERRATAAALAARGRPSLTIRMPTVDAEHIGELIMLLQIATVFAGELYGVNPLDQPGVELGKRFTYALMGKVGSEKYLEEWNSLPRFDTGRKV